MAGLFQDTPTGHDACRGAGSHPGDVWLGEQPGRHGGDGFAAESAAPAGRGQPVTVAGGPGGWGIGRRAAGLLVQVGYGQVQDLAGTGRRRADDRADLARVGTTDHCR